MAFKIPALPHPVNTPIKLPRLQICVFAIIILGITARMGHYLLNSSLQRDEAALALNVLSRSYGELIQPLEIDQAAPLLFLWTAKTVTALLGEYEWVLRLVPLLASIAALWAFYKVSLKSFSPIAMLVALALLAFSRHILHYSVFFKQYSSDVLITVIGLFVAFNLHDSSLGKKAILLWGGLGALLVWASFPVIFILAAIGIANLILLVNKRYWKRASFMVLIGAIWLISLGVSYLVVLRSVKANGYLEDYWQGAFLPLSPQFIRWLPNTLIQMIDVPGGVAVYPRGLYLWIPVIGIGIAGIFSLIKRDVYLSLICLLPFPLTLLASAFHLYPFEERLILFLMPLLYIILGEGVQALASILLKFTSNRPVQVAATTLLVGVVLFWSIYYAFIVPARYDNQLLSAYKYVAESKTPTTHLYLYWNNEPVFQYYQKLYPHQFQSWKVSGYISVDQQSLMQIGHGLVWVIGGQISTNKQHDLIKLLDNMGARKDVKTFADSFALLYEFH